MPSGIYQHKKGQGGRKNRSGINGKGRHWKLSDKSKNNIRKSRMGTTQTEATKNKIKNTLKRPRPEFKGEKHPYWKGGLTSLQKQEKIAGRKRSEQCEICGAFGRICFDHDHKTGKFRGWICTRCNSAIGFVKDNTQLLEDIIEYLELNNKNITT